VGQLDPVTATVLVTGLLFVLLALGVHIGVALGLTGFLGLLLTVGERAALAQLRTIPYNSTAIFSLAAIPMFILMGDFFTRAGFAADLYKAAYNWMGRVRGGVAMATTVGAAIFGAISGSSVANAAVFTRIALPEMVKIGYDKRLATGAIAIAGTLDALIPPSIVAVLYGLITETSVGKLLIAGFIPGAVGMVLYIVTIYVRVRLNPSLAPVLAEAIPWRTRLASLAALWGVILVFSLTMGGIYTGLFTPTQAGAVGACMALVVAILRRGLRRDILWSTFKEAASTTCSIILILVGGVLFARFLAYTGLVRAFSDYLLALDLPPLGYLAAYGLIMVVLGMFMEAFAMMVLTLPLMFPVLTKVGYDPVWLGIVTIQLIAIGLVTPPVGLNVYVVKGASPIPLTLEDIFIGVGPFVIAAVVLLVLLVTFPWLVLVLPNLMV
jgi:tripartite ATP-independent transporter DctM subunit